MRHVFTLLLAWLLLTGLATQPTAAQTDGDPGPEATAEPASTGPTADGDGWRVPLASVGGERNLRLTGQIAQRELFLPIPDGMEAIALEAQTLTSPDVESGFVEVRNGDDVLTVIELSGEADDVMIPLDGATVQDGGIALTLLARLRSTDDICTTNLLGAWLLLQDATLVLAGDGQPPTTVGAFFPPILTDVTLVIPEAPTAAEADAALHTAAALALRYPAQMPALQVVTDASEAAASTPFSRAVVVREDADADAMTVDTSGDTPTLVLSGNAEGLANQGALLSGDTTALAAASSAAVLDLTAPDQLTGERFSFDALGLQNLQVSGIGRIELPLTLSQSAFGGPIQSMTLHLRGAYTPVSGNERGVLSIFVNGVLIDAVPLDNSSQFALTVDVPQATIQRDNTITAQFEYVPAGGLCTVGYGSFTGQISGESVVQIERGQALNPGFHRFPQALWPSFNVAFEPLNAESLATATTLISALQRLSATPLQFGVTSWQAAVDGDAPALLVAANSANVDSLNPPLLSQPLRVVDADGSERLRLDVDTNAAVLQAFEQNGRNVLLAQTSDTPALLASALEQSADGWYALQGDTLVVVDGQPPLNLRLRGGDMEVVPEEAPPPPWWVQYQPVIYIVIVVVVLLLVALTFPRVVRKRPS